MFTQTLIQANLNILLNLSQNPLSLEELAESMKTKQGRLATPLRILQEQGLVQEVDGLYHLNQVSEPVHNVISLIEPWMNYFDGQYYEIAKDVAEIILKKSWDEVCVQDVLIFGSASRGDSNPNDLDLVILHSGNELQEFDRDPYGVRTDWIKQYDMPPISGNLRYDAYSIFSLLGYKGNPRDNYITNDWEKMEEYIKDSAFQNIVKRVEQLGIRPPKGYRFEDRDLFAALFDVHVLHTGLLGDPNAVESELEWCKGFREERVQELRDEKIQYFAKRREQAIESCRDPTFWYTVLTSGRLYDPDKHDFSSIVNDKYPGAAELFKR